MSSAEEEQEPPTKKQKNAVLPIPPLLPKPPSCSDQKSGSPASLRNQQAKPPSCSDQSSGSTANTCILNQRATSHSSSDQSSGITASIFNQRTKSPSSSGQNSEVQQIFSTSELSPLQVVARVQEVSSLTSKGCLVCSRVAKEVRTVLKWTTCSILNHNCHTMCRRVSCFGM